MCEFRFSFVLLGCLLASLSCDLTLADVVEIVGEPGNTAGGSVYKISVTPAQPPVPVFKYRLTVEPFKTIPGNAITHYLRSLGENSLNGPWNDARDQYGMDVHAWYRLKTRVEDIPLDKLRQAAGLFDSYVDDHLRRATMCRDCDWGLAVEDLRGLETIGFLLPSVQQTRSMARVLMLRNRLAVIDGRFDDSVDHLRMTYQLGQNVNELHFLVANLVGIAEVGMANEGLLDLIAAKDAPNMYWALAELPEPIISIRDSLRLESSFAMRCFPILMDVETAEYSKEKWSKSLSELIERIKETMELTTGSNRNPGTSIQSDFLAVAAGMAGYTAAKQRLLDAGLDPDRVQGMAVAQVLLIDAARDCQILMNEMEKTFYVPYTKMGEFENQAESQVRGSVRLGAILVNLLSPAIVQVRQAEVFVQAQVNLLMAIESIRNHIAKTGKLPESLQELELPVRRNPLTDKPFEFERVGDTVVLSLQRGGGYWQRYEISIAPK